MSGSPAPRPDPAASVGVSPDETANLSQLAETVLQVEGMVCQGYTDAAKSCLTGIDGVASADVSLDDRSARVRYDPSKTSPLAMVAALEAVDRGEAPPFHATVSGSGE